MCQDVEDVAGGLLEDGQPVDLRVAEQLHRLLEALGRVDGGERLQVVVGAEDFTPRRDLVLLELAKAILDAVAGAGPIIVPVVLVQNLDEVGDGEHADEASSGAVPRIELIVFVGDGSSPSYRYTYIEFLPF